MSETVKACPFCGGAGVPEDTVMNHRVAYYVACQNEACDVRAETPCCASPEVALKLWNTRAPLTDAECERAYPLPAAWDVEQLQHAERMVTRLSERNRERTYNADAARMTRRGNNVHNACACILRLITRELRRVPQQTPLRTGGGGDGNV